MCGGVVNLLGLLDGARLQALYCDVLAVDDQGDGPGAEVQVHLLDQQGAERRQPQRFLTCKVFQIECQKSQKFAKFV